jgi:hypothetical protein
MTAMRTPTLPSELWTDIFDLATTEDDILFSHDLPNSMDKSEWFQTLYGHWILRSPQELTNSLQRKGYLTKKASE